MKTTHKSLFVILVLTVCVSLFSMVTVACATTYQNTIFGQYDVYLPSTMIAEFQVTTRKPVASVSISATMQVSENGVWENYYTGISPAFYGSNKTGWDTTADYSSACAKGKKYRLVVTYSSSGATADYTSNSRTY